jgi:anhydro-N-acetylmuramic acid kinase
MRWCDGLDPSKRYDDGRPHRRERHADRVRDRRLLSHPYFAAEPPKSTGRELFDDAYVST